MKFAYKTLLVFCLLIFCYCSKAQTVIWSDDFQNACASSCLATSYGWNVNLINTGLGNGADANIWYVSGTECGNVSGACGSSCGATDPSLHISSGAALLGDQGAVYAAGGLGFFAVETDKRVESPVINLSGQSNMTLSFNFMENGDGSTDNAELWYYNGAAWSLLVDLIKTALNCSPQGIWTSFNMPMPASANNNTNVQLGFRWYNNDDNIGTDPSFAVDDIMITIPGTGTTPSTGFSANDSTICEGDCIDFTDISTNSPTSWEWSFPGASPASSTSQNPTSICYNTAGDYDVTLIAFNANGSDTLEKTQYISAVTCLLPNCSFSYSDSNLCEGDCIDFSDLSSGNPTSWEWSFPGAIPSTSNLKSPTNICYSSVGTYDVGLIVTNTNGSDSLNETQKITVNSAPTIQVSNDSAIFTGGSIQLSASGGLTYLWSPSTGLDDPTSSSPIATPSQSTTYTITITDQNNCIATASVKIEVLPLQSLFIPTAFSPNSDSQNDILYIRGSGIGQLILKIYDRYGQMVFETTDINKGWDGSFKGKPLSNNVFTYYLSGSYLSGEIIEQKGTISLVR